MLLFLCVQGTFARFRAKTTPPRLPISLKGRSLLHAGDYWLGPIQVKQRSGLVVNYQAGMEPPSGFFMQFWGVQQNEPGGKFWYD